MKYGYFDLSNQEYVITKPDTPSPWVNYLGSPEYGAIVSNQGEGYSFVKSGANGRILRFRFNSKIGLPGRYVYIRDNDDGDYWSATWQPVGKNLDEYKCVCRHGTAYTVIDSDYSGIHSELSYYVPLNETYEVWHVKITNNSTKARNLSLFGFCEFTNEDNYEQDLVNIQYSLFISSTTFEKNKIVQHINKNSYKNENGFNNKERFFGMAGAEVKSYCGDLDSFIGAYRDYSNPVAVEKGDCGNKLNYNTNSCGGLHTDMLLNPGESREVVFLVGRKNPDEADEIICAYKNPGVADEEINQLKNYGHGELNKFQVEAPSEEFNNMVNVWNAYQCYITFIWSRAASFIYCGLRNGYGYRDTVQDIQGIIHLNPELAAEKIRFMLSAQVDNGGGLPLVKFDHNPGHESCPDENDENSQYAKETGHPCYRADDALWLFPTVEKYISESGNTAFLDEVIPFSNKGEATVYEHLKRAVDFSLNRLGAHKMPAGLYADWNDCLRLGKKGESVFVAFQLYLAINILLKYAKQKNDDEYISYLENAQKELSASLEKCWDTDRFIRGYREDGEKVGARDDKEANMWLNPQTWGIISGFATKEQALKSMDKAEEILNTPYGVKIMNPPYENCQFDGALMHIFNPYTKENGGIFSQTQGWAILAESLLGRGDRAFEYFMESSPASMNDKAEIRVMEPYVHGQFTESDGSPYAGRSHVHWLTGTGSTVMVGCVEGICGMRPNAQGLEINPAIPHEWEGFKISKKFRGKHLSIDVQNPGHVQSGVISLTVNGKKLEGNFVPESEMTDETKISVVLG